MGVLKDRQIDACGRGDHAWKVVGLGRLECAACPATETWPDDSEAP